ncbi:hypothetical protein BS50DRAFT_586601 [Corynespora cassiicola Philippines]|uniref:Uncharacterized protein n=1 Tax=Corynespora cassiicola Philippines TaxID=1448308 RepID=A0A2T2NV04_CORCC|nr:hypothetical protein BS50DRAFT_586601 [Corynespora cassiicola Philippines]
MEPRLFIFLLVANTLSAFATVICNPGHPGDVHLPGEDLAGSIRKIFEEPIIALYNDVTYANSSQVLYHETPSYTFQIDRQQHTDTVEACKAAFESIISDCVIGERVLGGEIYVNNVVYEIYYIELRKRDIISIHDQGYWIQPLQQSNNLDEDNFYSNGRENEELERHDLWARRVRKPTKRPTVQRPATQKPANGKPLTPKPRACEKQSGNTSPQPKQRLNTVHHPTASVDSSCVAEEVDCKKVIVLAEESNKIDMLATRGIEEYHGIVERVAHHLQKRAPKVVSVCGLAFAADSYPDHKSPMLVCIFRPKLLSS